MYFIAILIKLKLLHNQRKLLAEDGVYVHAAVMKKITTADPEMGSRLHSLSRHKQVTMAIVNSSKMAAAFRVTFMTEEGLAYANILINMLSACPNLRLGKVTSEVEAVNLAEIATWTDLTTPELPDSYIRLQFVTPTAITKNDDQGGRFVSLFPDPLDVFSGLAKCWRAFGGPALPSDLEKFINEGGCVVASHSLNTVKFHTPERTQIGFVGQTIYEHRKKQDLQCINALNALARLAHFSGIGYQTARGMGAVQVSICPR